MYYIFLETNNDDFIKEIARVNCIKTIDKLFSDYDLVKQESGDYDKTLAEKYFEDKESMNLYLISCFMLLGRLCVNNDCCTKHETVFDLTQIKIFRGAIEQSFRDKASSKEQMKKDFSIRRGTERLYHDYVNKVINFIKIIEIEYDGKYDYNWNQYINKAKTYATKQGINGSFYIRADATDSDYYRFEKDMSLPNLAPCDVIYSTL